MKPPTRPQAVRPVTRQDRIRICFGADGAAWDEEKVLERYELLYEAGLVEESRRDGREAALAWGALPRFGSPMRFDHRRVLATAIGRLESVCGQTGTSDITLTEGCRIGPPADSA